MPTASRHPADLHGLIRARGARANHLEDVDVALPRRRVTGGGLPRLMRGPQVLDGPEPTLLCCGDAEPAS